MYVRTIGLVVALATALLAIGASSASAKPRDRNHDRISDHWERGHHLSLRVNQARRDQDKDGLKNLGEYRAHTNPRDDDSDGDGVEDGKEQAGRVTAFDGTTLTIDLFGKGTVTGMVTPDTEVECDHSDDNLDSQDNQDNQDDNQVEDSRQNDEQDGEKNDGESNNGDHHDEGDSANDDDHESDDNDCPADALKVDAIIQEADLKITSQGLVFDEIEVLVK